MTVSSVPLLYPGESSANSKTALCAAGVPLLETAPPSFTDRAGTTPLMASSTV